MKNIFITAALMGLACAASTAPNSAQQTFRISELSSIPEPTHTAKQIFRQAELRS